MSYLDGFEVSSKEELGSIWTRKKRNTSEVIREFLGTDNEVMCTTLDSVDEAKAMANSFNHHIGRYGHPCAVHRRKNKVFLVRAD